MCLQKLINHLFNSVDVELTACMRIEHSSLINMLFFTCYGCFDGKKLNIDISHIHSGALYRKSTYVTGMNTVSINETGNLYAGIFGKVCDEMTCVKNITADFIRNTQWETMRLNLRN